MIGPRTGSWGTPDVTGTVRFLAPNNDLLLTATKESLYPAQGVGRLVEYFYDVEGCKLYAVTLVSVLQIASIQV